MLIGELSKNTGVNIETIRYYEKAGVMPAPPRSAGGRRLYGDAHQSRLSSVKRCRELGFSLEEVRSLLRLVDGGYTCGDVRKMTLAHQQSIKTKIADLKRLDKTLGKLAKNCEGGAAPDCPVIEALFFGAGRRN